MTKILFKLVFVLVVLLVVFLIWPKSLQAEEPVVLYLFWGQGCPHCAEEQVFLATLQREYGDRLVVKDYEVYYDQDNRLLFQRFATAYGQTVGGVPATFIGEQATIGYATDETTGQQIKNEIDVCLAGDCVDKGRAILGQRQGETGDQGKSERKPLLVNLPILGQTDLSRYSLFGLTAVIAAIDGFNPCAMWVLLILIGMLLGMQRRRRMWFLGSVFIVASALVYFVFLAAWLEFFKFIGAVRPVQVIIGLVALGVGVYYLNRFRKMRPGQCEVVDPERRKRLSEKIKRIVREQALWLALVGIVAVAFVVNLIELACSAGLPAIYTQVLSLSDLTRLQHYLYLGLYVFIFMLDDLLVFIIAMVTMRAVGTTGTYSRWATLVGGVVILILGLLLIIKPEWVMFG